MGKQPKTNTEIEDHCHSIFENRKKTDDLTFFYLLYILTSFLSLSFSICCYSEINRALSYRPKWLSKPRPYRNGIYDGRSTCGRGSHDASPAAGWIQLRLPTSSRGLLAILRTSVVQVRIQPFLNYFDVLLGRSKMIVIWLAILTKSFLDFRYFYRTKFRQMYSFLEKKMIFECPRCTSYFKSANKSFIWNTIELVSLRKQVAFKFDSSSISWKYHSILLPNSAKLIF